MLKSRTAVLGSTCCREVSVALAVTLGSRRLASRLPFCLRFVYFLSCVKICHTYSCGNEKLFPDVSRTTTSAIKQTLLVNDRPVIQLHSTAV